MIQFHVHFDAILQGTDWDELIIFPIWKVKPTKKNEEHTILATIQQQANGGLG